MNEKEITEMPDNGTNGLVFSLLIQRWEVLNNKLLLLNYEFNSQFNKVYEFVYQLWRYFVMHFVSQ